MDFKEWLMYFIDVDRPVGDLAKDVKGDSKFPDSYEEICDYLDSFSRRDALRTFKYVWVFYLEDTKPD